MMMMMMMMMMSENNTTPPPKRERKKERKTSPPKKDARSLEASRCLSSLASLLSGLLLWCSSFAPFIIKERKRETKSHFFRVSKRHYLKVRTLECQFLIFFSRRLKCFEGLYLLETTLHTRERVLPPFGPLTICNSLQNIRTKKCGGSAWCCVETPTLRRRRWSSLAAVVVVVVVLGAFEDDEEGPPQ